MGETGTVAIVGVGLIGGSIGRTIREREPGTRVVGIGRSASRLAEAVDHGAIDCGTTDLAEGVADARVVVVCTPVTEIAHTVRQVAAFGPREKLITDAGSTKRRIVEEIEADTTASDLFVGAHPIAGSHRQGVAFANPRLFEGRVCVLTPTPSTSASALEIARSFWSGLGCRLIEMDPKHHDQTLALTSHLPHVVAAALAASVPTTALDLAAGAYRDVTRVAAADGALWSAIFRENQPPLLDAIEQFERELSRLKSALVAADDDAIQTWWNIGRARREEFEERQEKPPVKD